MVLNLQKDKEMSPFVKAFYILSVSLLLLLPSMAHAQNTEKPSPELMELLEKLIAEREAKRSKPVNNGKKTMKGASWGNAEPEKQVEKTTGEDDEDFDKYFGEDDTDTADEDKEGEINKRPLTPEEKLWRKYKNMAETNEKQAVVAVKKGDEAGKSSSKENPTPQKTEETEDEFEEETTQLDGTIESKEETEPEEEFGIMSILKKYKDSKKEKGEINSRSFGNKSIR